MMEVEGEHQELLQFLYTVPVGLVHASEQGDIELINSASARWLLPLTPDGRLDNLFTVLSKVAPGLRGAVAGPSAPSGVIVDHLRIEVNGGRRREAGPEYIAMTLSRLDNRRLMAVFNDITQQVHDELALGDSEAHYRAVVSVLSEGIVLHDPAGRLLMCNAAAERSVGAPLPVFQSGTAVARAWSAQWPDGRPMADPETPTGIVLAGGPAQERVTVASVATSGERRWFEVSARPVIRPGTTERLAVVTSFTDVTQRQRLQDELQQHRQHLQELVARRTQELERTNAALSAQQQQVRAVADAVPGMIGYWDADLRCRFSNKAYLEWFGRTPDEMAGIAMPEALGAELFALNRPHIDAALRGEPQHFQRSIRKPDGSVGHTLTSYIPDVAEGRVRGFNVVVSDVTALKQAELRLESLNEQLQRRAVQADEATRAKSAFLANMSHEIRTPMNAIIGLSHLMRREATDATQLARLHKIGDASQHLLQLINDVLDLSKIEAGKMTLDEGPFVTRDLLARALDMVSAQAREKSLDIGLACDTLPGRLRGDAVRLSQCLINLLANAVKFTERGGVRLSGWVAQREADRALVRFEVQDTGPGISAERRDALFSAFEQADGSLTRRHGGTGLGLALTRHFARLMGGDAGVHSEPGAGSTFWFTARLGVPASAPEDDPGPGLRGLRALLIEQRPDALQALVQGLGSLGLEVDAHDGAAEGLGRLEAAMSAGRPYDLVLVAGSMQPLDGFDVLQRIRHGLGAGTPPCVLLTSEAGEPIAQRARAAGFAEVLNTPADPALLAQAVKRALLQPEPPPPFTPAAASADSESQIRRSLPGRRVLLVEDNPINQEVAVELLDIVGLVVETATDGARAVELARTRGYDLILMDVQMPVMDGLAATRALRAAGLRTPIVAMTANAFAQEREACLAAGMNDHVAKPVDPAVFYATLWRWLRGDAAVGPPRPPFEAGGERQATPLADRLATVRGLDVSAAMRAVGGKAGTLERVMRRFNEVYARDGSGSVFGNDMAATARLKAAAHSLRGACASIGATELQLELSRFERELDQQPDTSHRIERVRALDARLDELVAQLAAALGGSRTGDGASLP